MSLDITRIEAAHRAHAAAVETIQRLTGQLDTAFAHLEAGQDRLAQEGVDTTLRMPDWMQAAYTHWRTGQQHAERERVTAERMARVLERVPSRELASVER